MLPGCSLSLALQLPPPVTRGLRRHSCRTLQPPLLHGPAFCVVPEIPGEGLCVAGLGQALLLTKELSETGDFLGLGSGPACVRDVCGEPANP